MEIWKKNLFVCWFSVFAVSSGMSQIAPILPLYIEHLGIHDVAAIEQWSGIAFGINFITLAVFSPIWGKAADKYGRKPMLLRASLWLALIGTAMGFAQNVYQFVALRMLQGALSGFIAAAITLVATQTPSERVGWALGTLTTGSVGGALLGPLFGGYLAETLGIRSNFIAMGILATLAFLTTWFFVKENFTKSSKETLSMAEAWKLIPHPGLFVAMCATTFVMQLAIMSIEPIVTVYVTQLSQTGTHIALIAGAVFSASGLANVLAAPRLGRLSDKIGPHRVILAALVLAGVLQIPQAFVQASWQLGVLRFLLGIAVAGLLPSINTLVRRSTPDRVTGRAYGFSQSAQFLGMFAGAAAGGQIAAHFGIQNVFFFTGALLLANALWVYKTVYRKCCAILPGKR